MNSITYISVVAFAFGLIKVLDASGTISLKLETFRNARQRDFNGQCCDGDKAAWTCTGECDTYLIMCLSSSNITSRCDHGSLWMGEGDEAFFPNVFGTRIKETGTSRYYDNPYMHKFEKWNGTFALKIEVFDDDSLPRRSHHEFNEKVDELQTVLTMNAGQNASLANNYTSTLRGRNVELRMSAKVWCDMYYLVPDCTEYCRASNESRSSGYYYRCNYEIGKKECLEGWYGRECNKEILKCHPQNDTQHGHFKCNATSGEKICLEGWYDVEVNCTKAIAFLNGTLKETFNATLNATLNAILNAIINKTLTTTTFPTTPKILNHSSSSTTIRFFVRPSLPYLESKDFASKPGETKDEGLKSNVIVYICGVLALSVLLIIAFLGVIKFFSSYKKFRAVAPAETESWQKTRRKRTISTKTGFPPITSTKVSYQVTKYPSNENRHVQKVGLGSIKEYASQVKSFDAEREKMKRERKVIFVANQNIITMVLDASGTISLKLETFRNARQRDFNGQCCDGDKAAWTCTGECDTYLIMCLSSSNITSRCDHGSLWMGEGDEAFFPNVFGTKIKETGTSRYYDNPYMHKFEKWNGTFALKIEVFDDDSLPRRSHHEFNEKVDELQTVLTMNAGQNASHANNYTSTLRGRNVELRMSAKVWCDMYYLVPDCTEYCRANNESRSSGYYYRCNYEMGKKECLEGWYGRECNKEILECDPQNDTQHGHFKCNATSGEKICLDGWYDVEVNCTKAIALLNATLRKTLTTTISPATLEVHNNSSSSAKPCKTKDHALKSYAIAYISGLVVLSVLFVAALFGIIKFFVFFKKFRAVAPADQSED
eukprot:gene19041-20954_t